MLDKGVRKIIFGLADITDAAIIINREQNIIDGNGAFLRLFGFGADFLDGTHQLDELIPDHCKELHSHNVESMFLTPSVRSMASNQNDVKGVNSGGKVIPLVITFYPIRENDNGIPIEFCAILSRRAIKSTKWKDISTWAPVVLSVVGLVGWVLGLPGALDLIIGSAGLKVGASIAANNKNGDRK